MFYIYKIDMDNNISTDINIDTKNLELNNKVLELNNKVLELSNKVAELNNINDNLHEKLLTEREEYKFFYKKIKDYDMDNNINYKNLNNISNIKNIKLENDLDAKFVENIKLKKDNKKLEEDVKKYKDDIERLNTLLSEEIKKSDDLAGLLEKELSKNNLKIEQSNDNTLYNIGKMLHCIVM